MNARISTCLMSLACVALVGCGEEEPAAKPEAKPEKVTVKNWQPDDPELQKGKAVYDATCALCHGDGEEGAPRLNNEKQWAARREKGLDTLIKHAIEGFHGDSGDMPARGDNASLTDEEVANAVRFMVEASKL